ncbi:hypothetical protein TrVGV298_007002 [Trichoderma virens]|nr:hypothetical protein TrVGV298_007002 [Trichoderma virens]
MTATAITVPNGPDTKNGYIFIYANIPLLVIATAIVGFRVWWRCVKNGGGGLNKADICVVICLSSINIEAFWYGQSGWNTLMDVVVLVLPIPVILKLQMNRRAKLSILAVFVLGAFVCITSIERLISLNFNATFILDFTWATGTSVIWTQVESTVGVICACAPSLRMPLARFIPFLFGSSKHDCSYELSDGVPGGGAQSSNWNNESHRLKKPSGFDDGMDDLELNYKSEGSEERIMGIKKTVSINATFQAGSRGADASTNKYSP